jgi:hypothetical protein
MVKTIPITLSVTVYNEYADEIPDSLTVNITEKLYQRILKISKILKRNDLDSTSEYNYEPEFFMESGDTEEVTPYEGGRECEMLVITDTSFYWKGVLKHTDIQYESELFSIKGLKELMKLYDRPLSDMAKLINDEDECTAAIAKLRLEAGE